MPTCPVCSTPYSGAPGAVVSCGCCGEFLRVPGDASVKVTGRCPACNAELKAAADVPFRCWNCGRTVRMILDRGERATASSRMANVVTVSFSGSLSGFFERHPVATLACVTVLLLPLVVLTGYGVYSAGNQHPEPPALNDANYGGVREGMSPDEVFWALGSPTTDTGEIHVRGIPGSARGWEYQRGGKTVTVVFDSNGRVVYKDRKGF